MSVTVHFPNMAIHQWIPLKRDTQEEAGGVTVELPKMLSGADSTLLKTWLVTRKAESEKKQLEKEEKKEREMNMWLLQDEDETREEVSERITFPISDTIETVPVAYQKMVEEPVSRELQSWMSGPQIEEKKEPNMEDWEHKDGRQNHLLNSWLVMECQDSLSGRNDKTNISENNVPEVKDVSNFSFNNWIVESKESHEKEENQGAELDGDNSGPTENCWLFKYPEDDNVVTEKKDVEIENLVENCWLIPKQDGNQVTEKLSVDDNEENTSMSGSEKNRWLLTNQDNKETDSSLVEDTDISKENTDTTPTEFNIWLSKSDEVETNFHDEDNETVKLEVIIPELEAKIEDVVPTREEITMIKEKMTLMSMWREADPEEQSWDAVNETAESEASIVTLDPTEDFDDFSDMQLELSQWISNV